ncbi:MAG: hypothetical protein IKU52_07430 [Clostridia bacterium]|nr:hypothetical protein [Clostridia bacterium]
MKDKRYDLNLGDWGPYNKEYMGACHIADKKRGATFNIEMFPGFFRRSVLAHNSKSDTGIKLWGANAELSRFCYRYELQWKDEVYCDVDYNITDDKQLDITCTFVNNTDINQSLDITLCASMQLPTRKPGSEVVGYFDFYRPLLPKGCIYIDATEHAEINCNCKIAGDGNRIAEEIHNGASGLGTAIDGYFFNQEGHYLKYNFNKIKADSIGIRYNCENDTDIIVKTKENYYALLLKAVPEYTYLTSVIKEEELSEITLYSTGAPINIDCICIGKDASKVEFEKIEHNLIPEKSFGENTMTLKFKDLPKTYTVKYFEPIRHYRECYTYDIGKLLQLTVNDHVSETVTGIGEGVYQALLSTPVYLCPGENQIRRFRVYTDEEVETKKNPISCVDSNPDGTDFVFSQNMMRYNTLLNVVYPIYTRRQYIKHNAPGRFWDSLYSWDSGFIGMGLANVDFQRGFDCLNTYLVPVGDTQSPYIFHGSVVPTQIFLYKYLTDKFPNHKMELKELYPMIKQYYDFYANLDKGEEQLASGILKTWHLSYNSGGWDDYPPQHQLRNAPLDDPNIYNHSNTTPVITTAFTVLISKILMLIADNFGYSEDIPYYESVAKKYTQRIENHKLWDSECGYFSYMFHDEKGMPKDFMRYTDNTNYNMGMDGITPYIADICTPEQETAIKDNIINGLMTDIGVGVVDKRAPYYSPFGYWNGSVWMPHQWILWKALTDRGESELAFEIAQKSLTVWAKEVNYSYCCFENFMCHNGRGSGYHHFSGLSCPISLFFAGYYTPGTLTPGFASMINEVNWNNDSTSVCFNAAVSKNNTHVLVCMRSGYDYKFTVNGNRVNPKKITEGAYTLPLPKGNVNVNITK